MLRRRENDFLATVSNEMNDCELTTWKAHSPRLQKPHRRKAVDVFRLFSQIQKQRQLVKWGEKHTVSSFLQ